MSYKRIPEIPRAERTYWSSEAGGRTRQRVGGKWVRKFSFSPYTAEPRERYTFYADIEMVKELVYEGMKGKPPFRVKHFVMPAYVGTFREFKEEVLSGRVAERISFVSHGEAIKSVSYWRNRGER